MRCNPVRDRLMTDPAAGEAMEISRHLADCARCRAFAARLGTARRGLAAPAGEPVLPDAAFSARVLERLPERRPADHLGWAALRLLPAAAASAVVLTGWCLWATPAPEDVWSAARAGDTAEGDLVAWVLDFEASPDEPALSDGEEFGFGESGAGESARP